MIKKTRIAAVFLLAIQLFCLCACSRSNSNVNSAIIVGKDGWLFEKECESGSEYRDFTGENALNGEQLDEILASVKSRRSFLAKNNMDLIIVLVPDKMSLYESKLPDSIKEKKNSSDNRLKAVYNVIKKNTRVGIVDLTEIYSMNKDAFDIYERTDSMLSDMGAYIAYTEIVKAVSKLNISVLRTAALDEFNLNVADDHGKELALRIGEAEKYRNKTISLKYKGKEEYHNINCTYDGVDVTVIDENDRNPEFRYTNVIIYGNANIAPMKKFISLSFKTAVYVDGYSFDQAPIDDYKPSQAVIVVNEKELEVLLDSGIIEDDTVPDEISDEDDGTDDEDF